VTELTGPRGTPRADRQESTLVTGDAAFEVARPRSLATRPAQAGGQLHAQRRKCDAMWAPLFSLVYWTLLVASSVPLFAVALGIWAATAPFSSRRALLHRFTCFWASLYTWLNPAWSISIEDRAKLDPRQTYVIVANHLSLLDILLLCRLFAHFKFVSKIENFRVPLIGWNMSLNRYIAVRRGDRSSLLRMFEQCERTLREGSSILMFPEGTRSPDGRLREFKPGAFELAQRTRRPILPLAIQGTAEALPKRGFILRGRHRMRICVLDEIPVGEVTAQPVEALMKQARARIESALRGAQNEPRGAL
jgi:1-acyl-sn-glycerol-3-phosphate acyltransferase